MDGRNERDNGSFIIAETTLLFAADIGFIGLDVISREQIALHFIHNRLLRGIGGEVVLFLPVVL